ncbi:MAG: CvpA family protein [Thermoflexibacter sp.]|nr:CvpA family protein [Thermoflexibacter sp.]
MVDGFSSVSFTLIDIIIFFLVCWGAYKGYQKGFLTELLSIVFFMIFLIFGFWLVKTGYGSLASQTSIGSFSKATHFFTFLVVYGIIVIIVSLIDRRMQEKSSLDIFEGLDNFVGLVLGAFKYAFALSVLSEMLTAVGIFKAAEMNNTLFYPMLSRMFDFIFQIGNAISPFIGDLVGGVTRLLSR